MKHVLETLQKVYSNKELRNKFLFTALIFAVFRFFAHVPVPGVNTVELQKLFANNQILGVLNIFSGGTLSRFSVMAIGINPYITASIIFQLATMIFPPLKEMSKDGEAGRERINQYTRFLAVPLGVVQSISILVLLNSQKLIETQNPLAIVAMIFTMVAGAMMLMWLGELVTMYGIGNGISMVLFAGIVGQLPVSIARFFSVTTSDQYLGFGLIAAVFLGVIACMVIVNEAIRKVNVQYAKRVRGSRLYGGQTTHLPLKINTAGVLPIIFAVSVMLVPAFVGRLLASSGDQRFVQLGQSLQVWFSQTSWIYAATYFVIVFIFTYFSTLVFFNTEDLADELKKSGAFVPGVRPGKPTQLLLNHIITRITFVGAVFLGLIAILPSLVERFTGITSLAIGGTGMLIVVSVVLETTKQIESLMVSQNYDKYI